MTEPLRDPEKNEQRFLDNIASPLQGRVLEIGSGDGRLTWLYSGGTDLTIGVDLELSKLRDANVNRSSGVPENVHWTAADAEALPFPAETFDVVLLGWSL